MDGKRKDSVVRKYTLDDIEHVEKEGRLVAVGLMIANELAEIGRLLRRKQL